MPISKTKSARFATAAILTVLASPFVTRAAAEHPQHETEDSESAPQASKGSASQGPTSSPEPQETKEQETSLFFYESAHPNQTAIDLVEEDLIRGQFVLKSVLGKSKSMVGLPMPLKVCFWDGGKREHDLVIEAASAGVDAGAGISFDFGGETPNYCIDDTEDTRSTIRVSVTGTRNYSLIGREALYPKFKDEPTMGIGFDKAMQEPLRKVVIKHEFGHALGLFHEILNPAADCIAEFDTPYMKQRLKGPPWNLSEDEIELDFLAMLRGSPDIKNSEFDRDSIMIYSLPKEFFKDHKSAECFVPQPMALSEIDVRDIRINYPTDKAEARRLAREYFQDGQLAVQSVDLKQAEKDKFASYIAGYAAFSVEGVSSEYAEYANALIEQADAALAAETGGTNR